MRPRPTRFTLVQGSDAPFDEQPNARSGRLVGEFETQRTFLLNVALVWNR